MIKEKHQGLLAILAANLIFGLNIPVTRALMAQWMSPLGYTVTRMLFGAMIFWVIGFFLRSQRVRGKDWLLMLVGGLSGFLGTQFLFSQSLRYTTPVVFSLLMALTPVIVLILSVIFLKEAVPRQKILGIGISISGALIIILGSSDAGTGSNNLLGMLFALLCALCYAIYLVLTRDISQRYPPVTIAKWMFLFAALPVVPFSFSALPQQRIYSGEGTPLAFSLLAFALLFSTTIAFFLMPVGLKKLPASTVSIFMNMQPIIASAVAMTVGQDVFTWDKPLAALLVVFGVYLVTVPRQSIRSRAPVHD